MAASGTPRPSQPSPKMHCPASAPSTKDYDYLLEDLATEQIFEAEETMAAQAGHTDFEFKSESPGLWCLNKQGRDLFMNITLARTGTDNVAKTIASNDPEIIKRTLSTPGDGLYVRSFQAVFSCNFPDNSGIGVADVLKFKEERTKRGELIHLVLTKFGCHQFGGPAKLMASQVKMGSEVVLYTATSSARRYYGG